MTLPLLQEFFTEAEAQEKVCPFASRFAAQADGCIGSGCMMWRWKHEGVTCERGEPVGYCGVGGKP